MSLVGEDGVSDVVQFPAIAIVGVVMALLEVDEENEEQEKKDRLENIAMVALRSKRALDDYDKELATPKMKRDYIRYDRERARRSVQDDYFGPHPTFRDYQFERFFRITRTMAQLVFETCGRGDRFFRDGADALGRRNICPPAGLRGKCFMFCRLFPDGDYDR